MNRKVLLPLFVIALLGGVMLGIATPQQPVNAASTATIHIYAGVDYGSAYLTCGWHLDCISPVSAERGLDFIATSDGSGTARAFFNGWGFTGSTSTVPIGYMLVGSDPAPGNSICPATSVIMYNMQVSETNKRGFYYMHSAPTTTGYYTLYGRNLSTGGYWNTRQVGTFSQTANCPSVPHIMTWYAGFGTYDITPRDAWYSCPLPSPNFPCAQGTYMQLPHDLNDWAYVTQYANP